MKSNEIIEMLKNDEHYYGEFGKRYLSNSDISTLLTNPLDYGKRTIDSPNLVLGKYFHTAILEPDKLERFKIIDSSTRNTNKYKELSGGEICMLQQEADNILKMRDKLLANDTCRDLLQNGKIEYEVPSIGEIANNMWKGKADILNHDEKLIIDLKTTSDINNFPQSARKYNYDSQAYIYSNLFGYDMLFIAIDKTSHAIGLYDCSVEFYERGELKVEKASAAYDLFFNTPDFNPNNYFINRTL